MEYIFTEQAVVDLLAELVKIKSPYFEEKDVVRDVNQWFQNQGIPSYIHEYTEDKITHFHGQNVIVSLKGKNPGKKICFNGHLDTVSLCEGWTKNPWGEQEKDKFYGVGALDMKGGVAAQMLAIRAFYETYHTHFSGEIIGTFVSDEEGPYGLGTDAVLNDGLLKGTDVAIISEPNAPFCNVEFPTVSLGCHGIFSLGIELFGKPAHASKPFEGINAIVDASKVIVELEKTQFRVDPQMGQSISCVLGIENKVEPCSVPDYAKILVIRHTVTGDTKETVREEVVRAIERAGVQCTWRITFREAPSDQTDGFLAYTVEEDHPYTKLLTQCVEACCGKKPSITYFAGCSDGCYLADRLGGSPVYLFGPTGENYHSSDEYVTISSVLETAKTLYAFLEKALLPEGENEQDN